MPISFERKMAYNWARAQGLSRESARNVTTLAQAERKLKKIFPYKEKTWAITAITQEAFDNPYHYAVALRAGPNEEHTNVIFLTVVSDVPLNAEEIVSRAIRAFEYFGYSKEGSIYIYAVSIEGGTHWSTARP